MTGIRIRGERLRVLRHQKRLTGASLGAQVERTETQIYRVESGTSATSLKTLDRLADVFGVEQVAGLILDDDQRAIFLAAHLDSAGVQQ